MLQCDLFSLGRFKLHRDGKELETDPFLKKIRNPNPYQTTRQWLWDYMFWTMIGCAYMVAKSKVMSDTNRMFWLQNDKITFPPSLQNKLDKIYMSDSQIREIEKRLVKYRYADGTFQQFPLSQLKVFADISNGFGNWYSSKSRLDALYKIISNSEAALDAKNTNLLFSGKFMVSGKNDVSNQYEMPLHTEEAQSIENATLSSRPVTALKSLVDVKRYVENIDKLKLDASYLADYYSIGKIFNIPRDVLEAYESSTFENQEKARGSHVSYTLQPKAEDLCNGLETYFGYDEKGIEISLTYDHLQFMQVFEKDKAIVRMTNARTLDTLVKNGADANEVGPELGFDNKFKSNTNE